MMKIKTFKAAASEAVYLLTMTALFILSLCNALYVLLNL